MDCFQRQALRLLTSPQAARAFDLNLETPKVRARYSLYQGVSNFSRHAD